MPGTTRYIFIWSTTTTVNTGASMSCAKHFQEFETTTIILLLLLYCFSSLALFIVVRVTIVVLLPVVLIARRRKMVAHLFDLAESRYSCLSSCVHRRSNPPPPPYVPPRFSSATNAR